jgi:flagellar biosynthetic protein FliP
MRPAAVVAAVALAACALGAPAFAQSVPQGPPAPGAAPSLTLTLSGDPTNPRQLGGAIEIVLLMTALSLAPAIVLTMTCFTRIVIVLSFLKRAMAMQEFPPSLVVSGFAVFMTAFVMKPVVSDLHRDAYLPYVEGKLGFEAAAERAGERMKRFMLAQTRPDDIELILSLSKDARPQTPNDVPPVVVSTPLKLMLFLLVDGWNLVVGSLAESFVGA